MGLIQAQDIDTFHLDKSHYFSLNTGFSKYIERDDAMSPFNLSRAFFTDRDKL